MSELKVGDRVEVILPEFDGKYLFGENGIIVNLKDDSIAVEFDKNINGHDAGGIGKKGHCWRIPPEFLKKTNETKLSALEIKIIDGMKKEIGVEIGEEFDVYENERKKWTCRFEENGHLTRCNENGKFSMTFIWKYWIFRFDKYVFKKKPFMPQNGEEYFYLDIKPTSSEVKSLDAGVAVWNGISFDYGMLALGNVFRTKEEALKSEDKLLERLNELLKGE